MKPLNSTVGWLLALLVLIAALGLTYLGRIPLETGALIAALAAAELL